MLPTVMVTEPYSETVASMFASKVKIEAAEITIMAERATTETMIRRLFFLVFSPPRWWTKLVIATLSR